MEILDLPFKSQTLASFQFKRSLCVTLRTADPPVTQSSRKFDRLRLDYIKFHPLFERHYANCDDLLHNRTNTEISSNQLTRNRMKKIGYIPTLLLMANEKRQRTHAQRQTSLREALVLRRLF